MPKALDDGGAKMLNRKTLGATLVLIGLFVLIGIAGTSDVGRGGSLLSMIASGIVCLAVMGAGAKLIGGGAE